jgi:hypothetical protein
MYEQALVGQREQVLMAIVRDSAGVLEAHTDESGFAYQLSINLATARA